MTILDLIRKCPFSDVETKLKYHYDDYDEVKAEKFRKLYSDLSNKTIKNIIDGEWYLCITARIMQDDENGIDPAVQEFDENDKELYFDVSAYQKGDDRLYSIVSTLHEDFLQFIIDEDTLKKYTPATLLAHALWELTWFGYEDEREL